MESNAAKILRVARDVRKWGEKLARNPKVKGRRLSIHRRTLENGCGICSYELFKRLKAEGLRPTFVSSDWHAFILCSGYLVDVTATQFDEFREYPKVIVVPKDKLIESEFFWHVRKTTKTTDGIRMIMKTWPDDQIHPDVYE